LESAAAIAEKLTALVERQWAKASGLEPRDTSEVFLFLAYARGYRCFQSIRALCADPQSDGEDPLILTRALLSLALRSLWPVTTGDPKEREERAQRRVWYTVSEELKRVRALNKTSDAAYIDRLQNDLDEIEDWFGSNSSKPGELSEADIARKLELNIYYDLIYRLGSATTHHSQLAALGGFLHDEKGDEPFAPISLRRPKPKEVEEVLLWAVVVYGTFIANAETTMRIGVGEEADKLVREWLEAQQRQQAADKSASD
jgi:Family of unknown function (DUF5677)